MLPITPLHKNNILILLLMAVLTSLVLPPSHAGSFSEKKVLILQSHDPQLNAGELVAASTTVQLAPKEMLRVMMSSGEVAKIQGPYTGAIGSALSDNNVSNVNITDLAKAVVGRGQSRKALGAYRGSDQEGSAPRYRESIVRIIVGENGAYCVSPNQQLALWRPMTADTEFKLTLDAGRIKREINWPAGAQEMSIPAIVTDSKPRRIILPAQASLGPTRARLWFGNHGETPGEQLKWYESRGCEVQFESALNFYQTF